MNIQSHWKASLALVGLALIPACSGGGGGGGGAPQGPSVVRSSFTVDNPFGTPADGVSVVQLNVVVANKGGNALEGVPVEFRVKGNDAFDVAQDTVTTRVVDLEIQPAIIRGRFFKADVRAAFDPNGGL